MSHLKITLLDKNQGNIDTMLKALSLCKNKNCTEKTIGFCIDEEHLSALEKVWISFLVEGLSVKARIQLLRHRHFSTMERSTRHINMSQANFIVPETAKNKVYYTAAYDVMKKFYQAAIDNEESIEDAAYLLPLGTETTFTIDGNGRVFFEYLLKRLCPKHVQREHYKFAKALLLALYNIYPQIFNENYLGCKVCKHPCH